MAGIPPDFTDCVTDQICLVFLCNRKTMKMQMLEIQKDPVVLWKAKPFCDGAISLFFF